MFKWSSGILCYKFSLDQEKRKHDAFSTDSNIAKLYIDENEKLQTPIQFDACMFSGQHNLNALGLFVKHCEEIENF